MGGGLVGWAAGVGAVRRLARWGVGRNGGWGSAVGDVDGRRLNGLALDPGSAHSPPALLTQTLSASLLGLVLSCSPGGRMVEAKRQSIWTWEAYLDWEAVQPIR